MEIREIRTKQRDDPIIGIWHRAVFDKKLPRKDIIASNPKHQTMTRSFKQLHMIREILYRKINEHGEDLNQLVGLLPERLRKQVMIGLHTDVGHPDTDITISLIREIFYWPGYTREIQTYVEQCRRYLYRKSSTNIKAPMINITSTYPLQRVCMDYLKFDPCKGNIDNDRSLHTVFCSSSHNKPDGKNNSRSIS